MEMAVRKMDFGETISELNEFRALIEGEGFIGSLDIDDSFVPDMIQAVAQIHLQ